MSYYIGLSILSTDTAKNQKKRLSTEARRVLTLLNGSPVEEADIATETGGRPFFIKKEADFNITHCVDITAVSYVKGKNLRTGCDIERIRPRKGAEQIAEEFFSPYEKKYLYSSGEFDKIKFFEIWTLKECFIKLKGLSVFDMNTVPSFISQSLEFCFTAPPPLVFRLYELTDNSNPDNIKEHYMLAAAVEGSRQSLEILWFSQTSLDCKIKAEIKAAPSPAQTVSPKM